MFNLDTAIPNKIIIWSAVNVILQYCSGHRLLKGKIDSILKKKIYEKTPPITDALAYGWVLSECIVEHRK